MSAQTVWMEPISTTLGAGRDSLTNMSTLRLTDHLALAISATAIAMAGVKVTAVAHGDAATVAAIIDSQGVALLPAVLLTGVSTLVLVPLLLSTQFWGEAIRDRDPVGRLPIVFAGTLVLAVLAAERTWLITALVWAAVWLGTSWIWRVGNWGFLSVTPRTSPLNSGALLVLCYVAAVIATAASPRPWLPPETGSLAGETFVGYVLKNDGVILTLLTEHERHILRVPAGDLKNRSLCQIGTTGRSAITWILWRKDRPYDKCPRPSRNLY